jgi:microcystin-dependent protein
MSEPFLSELRIVSFNFPPRGWAFCNGQVLPINQNQALFSLLGTTFGGNGQTTFGLPDLRGRVPVHVGAGFNLGQNGGQQAHTVTISEMPFHTHILNSANTNAGTNSPNAAVLANSTAVYHAPTNLVPLHPGSVAPVGGNQPHTNMQPYLTLSFCIALQGIFPSRN